MKLATYITKLSFLSCTFENDDAAQRFLAFFQTPSTSLHQRAVLKELIIHFYGEQLVGMQVGSFIASLVTMREGSVESTHQMQQRHVESSIHGDIEGYCGTIGSQLEVQSLPILPMGVFETMLSRTNAIRLPCLHLSWLGEDQVLEMCKCLPSMLSIRELRLGRYNNRVMKVIRENGNLETVAVDDDASSVVNDARNHLIESFCQRNIVLHKIRSGEVQWGNKKCTSLIDECDIWHQHKKCKTDIRDTIPVAVLPAILQAAKQVPLTCVSMTISSLLLFRYECE